MSEAPRDGDPQPPALEMTSVTKHFDGGLIKALDGLAYKAVRDAAVR